MIDSNTIAVEFKPTHPKAKKIIPLILMIAVILADQITKIIITKTIPLAFPPHIVSVVGDIIQLTHVCNPGIAFSIGQGWSVAVRSVLFRIIPLIVIILVLAVYIRNDTFTQLQRWAIAGIAGGGFGNLIDRFFRKEGVIDFIDVKFYGIFGMERWPTFNVADAAVVVCGILLIVSFIITVKNEKNAGTGI